jgi:hypothetical protein
MKKLIVSAFALMLVVAVSGACFAKEHEKSSWYIGFGLGTGDGGWEIEGKEVTFDDWFEGFDTTPSVTGNLGVGAILNPKLHLGFDLSVISQEGDGEVHGYDVEANFQINNYLAALTYFPTGEGLFIKAGAGVSVITYEISGGPVSESRSDSGTAILGGLGYAFWLGKTFNLCLNAEYSHQSYDDEEAPDNSHFWNVYVSFYWF